MPNKVLLEDKAAVSNWAAEAWKKDIESAIAKNGRAVWVAAGGSTPIASYQVIAERFGGEMPWESIVVLMGDERCVPIGDPDSNWEQIEAHLLRPLSLSGPNLLRPPAEKGAEEGAAGYENAIEGLEGVRGKGAPWLHHVWLGMGEDGHTLSLFPSHPSLEERGHSVIPVHDSPKPPPDRISLSLEALEGAQHCLVLATGEGKREALRGALNGDESLPIYRAADTVEKAGGRVTWVIDRGAWG